MNTAQENLKCRCNACEQVIDFPAEMQGQIIECPSCAQPVRLEPEERRICQCKHCQSQLRFEAWRLGEKLICPSCGKETILYLPSVNKRKSADEEWMMGAIVLLGGLLGLLVAQMRDLSTEGMTSLIYFITGAIFLSIYLVPSFIAHRQGHPQKQAIVALNLFGGLTFIGWVVALTWSLMKQNKPAS